MSKSGAGPSVAFTVSYRVPLFARYGDAFDTGVALDVAGHEGSVGWNPMGLRVHIGDSPGGSTDHQ
ncbi:hypothetical protein [Rhodococcus maanshanensis]|uniref:Uncharacterized protein n=1 Tax=Rhodococcus maanshanensis TaxID=183556 RepID=A0A1H7WKH2_9NOCA|nr:hypothetical protein [Rhodococcus maanshanensis]SEM21971.1 hypothetical protein SAMN05444583_12750 [Rhodococcus maanshanensis]